MQLLDIQICSYFCVIFTKGNVRNKIISSSDIAQRSLNLYQLSVNYDQLSQVLYKPIRLLRKSRETILRECYQGFTRQHGFKQYLLCLVTKASQTHLPLFLRFAVSNDPVIIVELPVTTQYIFCLFRVGIELTTSLGLLTRHSIPVNVFISHICLLIVYFCDHNTFRYLNNVNTRKQ